MDFKKNSSRCIQKKEGKQGLEYILPVKKSGNIFPKLQKKNILDYFQNQKNILDNFQNNKTGKQPGKCGM